MRKLFSTLAAIAVSTSCSAAAAEELSLDCKAQLTNGKRHYKLHIDVSSDGAAVTTEDDLRVYYTNKSDQTQWFRINPSTIEFGARFTTVRLETVIRRDTGMYRAYSGEYAEHPREKGFCKKSEFARRVF
jgi:hypothetical protein